MDIPGAGAGVFHRDDDSDYGAAILDDPDSDMELAWSPCGTTSGVTVTMELHADARSSPRAHLLAAQVW
jgi:hypothetical protein